MSSWKAISDMVYDDLKNHTPLVDLLPNGEDGIYPLIAEAHEGKKYINYFTLYQGKPSKDGQYSFQVIVHTWADDYDEAIAIADEVLNAFGASSNGYSVVSGKPVFNDQDEFYIEQIFNIKK